MPEARVARDGDLVISVVRVSLASHDAPEADGSRTRCAVSDDARRAGRAPYRFAASDQTTLRPLVMPDATLSTRSLVARMRGAALLDIATYEEVEHDASATGQAAVVIVLAAVAACVGNLRGGGPGIVGAIVGYLVGWALWSGVTYLVGTRLFGGVATWGELLRTLGFAQAPGVLLVTAIVPGLGWLVALVVMLWLLVTGFVAIRQALDVDSGRAFLTAVVGWVVWVVARWLLLRIVGVPAY